MVDGLRLDRMEIAACRVAEGTKQEVGLVRILRLLMAVLAVLDPLQSLQPAIHTRVVSKVLNGIYRLLA